MNKINNYLKINYDDLASTFETLERQIARRGYVQTGPQTEYTISLFAVLHRRINFFWRQSILQHKSHIKKVS
jgi:hypothetical protein